MTSQFTKNILITLMDNNIIKEFKTKKAAEKFAKRIYDKQTGKSNGFVKTSDKSFFGFELTKGKKIFQVCTYDYLN